MNTIAFDIETIPNTSLIDRLPEPEVKTGNLKDQAKIAEKIEEAKKAQIEKMALSPLWGRVCCWCAHDGENSTGSCITEETDAEETAVIERAFQLLASDGLIVTYNGTSFDLPFLYRRAVILGIDPGEFDMPPLSSLLKRYDNEHHLDLMQVWCGYGQFEKLDTLSALILDDHKVEIDFHDFPELIKTKDGRNKILTYCAHDVELTHQLYTRIKGILI